MKSCPTQEEVDAYVEQVRRQHSDNLNALLHKAANGQGREALDYLEPKLHLVKGWARNQAPGFVTPVTLED